MWKTVFSHKDIVKLSYDFVAVVGHGNTAHKEHDYVVHGKKQHLCEVYNLPNCKSHEDMRMTLSQKNLLPGVKGTPTHILYDPHTMKEISRAHFQSVSAIEDMIAAGQRALGKPITWKAFSKIRKDLDDAKEQADEGDYRKALRSLKKFDAEGIKSLEDEAKALAEQIDEAGKKMLEEGRALLESGDSKGALKILRKVDREFHGTDIGKEAKDLIAEAKAK
jgi:hypothetical protein